MSDASDFQAGQDEIKSQLSQATRSDTLAYTAAIK